MKSLLVLRHAKSSWSDSSLADHQRPLNKRGRGDAPRMGELIRDEQLVPDCIMSSTAVRAITTAQIVADACGFTESVMPVEEFYMATPEAYLRNIALVDQRMRRVMVVGHNPGVEQLVAATSGAVETMPTAALAWIQFDINDWSDVESATGSLVQLWRPKELAD